MSGATLVLFEGAPGHWLRIANGAIVARGERPMVPADDDARVVALMPAADTIVHNLDVPGLTEAQARAAARLAIGETSAAAAESLHVAVGPEIADARRVVVLDARRMTQFLVDLASEGFDPDAVVPTVLVPPRPDDGAVRAVFDGEAVVCGATVAFADDPVLTPLLVPGPIEDLSREATEAALIAAVAVPPVDLRQGPFAKRRQWAVDRSRLKRVGWLAAACLAVTLLVPIARLINLNWTASAIEARNLTVAAANLPPGTAITDPVAQLDERLGAVGRQAGGALPLAIAVTRAIEGTPAVELGTMGYTAAAGLRVAVRATNPVDHQAVLAKLAAAGLVVADSAAATPAAAGAPTRELTVRRP